MRRVRIRGERHRHTRPRRDPHQRRRRINLLTILPQPRRVQLHRHLVLPQRRHELLVERRHILLRIKAELLREIRMRDDLEQPRLRRQRLPAEVFRPHLIHIAAPPFLEHVGIIQRPRVAHVMHRADEVIPGRARCEILDPVLMAGDVIHLQPQTDGERRMIPPRLLDLRHIGIEVTQQHAPVIEIIARHRIMLRETNLREAELDRLGGQFRGRALRVAAQKRVHVIIRRRIHARKMSVEPRPRRSKFSTK